jgi:UDP-2,3-diacylglucosamine pyrophosphatase LpxH
MPSKFKIVVSDLHLGSGRGVDLNPLEDFDGDQEFEALLEELASESDDHATEVELIVNGDAFEMLQVPHVEAFDPAAIYPPEAFHSSSEADSVLKMEIMIEGHRPFFDALGRFIRVGPPRRGVTFIKGNHDINLHWPGVQDRIREALGATGGRRSLLTFEERYISREGIYVEHGNQYASLLDRVEDMEQPHDHDDPDQLAIPVGSWFVMDVFNEVEREKYWIDGVKPITALVWYSLAYDFGFAARAIVALVRALPGILWETMREGDAPQAELVRQLEDPAQVRSLAARYETDEAFRQEFHTQVAAILAAPAEFRGLEASPVDSAAHPMEMGDEVRRRVNSSLYEMAGKRAVEERAGLVVFGHTHDAGVEVLPNGATYINSGTWTWRADFGGAGKETWQDLFEHPERFTEDRRLSYVRIEYDAAGNPSGRLLSYETAEHLEEDGEHTMATMWEAVLAWLTGLWGRLTGGS